MIVGGHRMIICIFRCMVVCLGDRVIIGFARRVIVRFVSHMIALTRMRLDAKERVQLVMVAKERVQPDHARPELSQRQARPSGTVIVHGLSLACSCACISPRGLPQKVMNISRQE